MNHLTIKLYITERNDIKMITYEIDRDGERDDQLDDYGDDDNLVKVNEDVYLHKCYVVSR